MKKQKYSGIILLMSISLLGIIAVQVFWMLQAINVKNEQFNQQINEAINKAAHRIERNQNAFFLSSMFSGNMQAIPNKFSQSNVIPPTNDSIIDEFGDFWNKENNSSGNKSNIRREVKNGIETTTYGFDTVIVSGNSRQHIQSYSSVISPAKEPKVTLEKKENNNPALIKKELSSVMDQMIMEFSVRDIPINERIDYSVIKPTLQYELRNLNIPLTFEYAITDNKGKPYNSLASKGYKDKSDNGTYKTHLFPNRINNDGELLQIYFPEKRSFVYGSLVWLFIASLIFTFIIVFTFYYTLKTILNQKRVSEIKTDFINNMTHEFKTPIATISLASDAISNPEIIKSPDKITRFIKVIKEENKRMNRQVESVLKMALIDKKDFNLNITEVYAHHLIEQAVNNISLQVEQKSGVINTKLEAATDLLRVDETHFINIIYNLLDNANKYALNQAPIIEIATYTANGSFHISVSDNGIGMDKETQDRIFEKFYRYSTGNVHTVKGFGLGLSYVKAIIHAFKGNITIKSEKGKGSTFTISIPH